MSVLAAFLHARITEDEEAAKSAGGDEWWVGKISTRSKADEPDKMIVDSNETLVTYEVCRDAFGDHIARHDPARVLAECYAKRCIVDACPPLVTFYGPAEPFVLRFLALPYADHPDYRQEWKP